MQLYFARTVSDRKDFRTGRFWADLHCLGQCLKNKGRRKRIFSYGNGDAGAGNVNGRAVESFTGEPGADSAGLQQLFKRSPEDGKGGSDCLYCPCKRHVSGQRNGLHHHGLCRGDHVKAEAVKRRTDDVCTVSYAALSNDGRTF